MKSFGNNLLFIIVALTFSAMIYGQAQQVATNDVADDATFALLKNDQERATYLLQRTESSWPQSPVSTAVFASNAIRYARQAHDTAAIARGLFYLAASYTEYNLTKAQSYLLEAQKLSTSVSDPLLNDAINNNLGILYQRAGDHKAALELFETMLDKYRAANDAGGMAILYHNMAISQFDLNNKQQANAYYQQAYRLNLEIGNTENAIRNMINLAAVYQDQGDTKTTLEYYLQADSMAHAANIDNLLNVTTLNLSQFYQEKNKNLSLRYAKEALALSRQQMNRNSEKIALQVISRYFADNQVWDSAFSYHQALAAVSDSINKYDDLYAIRLLKTEAELNHALLIETMKHTNTQNSLANTQQMFWIYLLASLLLFALLGIILYALRHRLRLGNIEKLKLVTHIQSVENDLSDKNKELATHLLYAHKKNEMLSTISEDLKKMNLEANSKDLSNIHQLITKLQKNSKEEIWPDFEKRFKEIHVDFYKNLTTRYPTLTPNEIKLCAFLKLNLSNKEISAITSQSTESIKIARHRLRAKLGLNRSDNLVNIIHQI